MAGEVQVRELIGKLEVVDDDMASALRVIQQFDGLVAARASMSAVVRAVTGLAGCPAGFHDASRASTIRFAPDGRTLDAAQEHSWPRMAVLGRPGSAVWLERVGPDGPLDTLILERAAQALSALAGEAMQRTTEAQVRIACDPDAGGDDRKNAARRLGLAGPVMVVVGSTVDLATPWRARIGADSVALMPAAYLLPEDIRAGADLAESPIELPTALEHARTALRIAADVGGLAPSLVRYDDLGALAEIIERFTPAAASGVPDVSRIDDLLAGHPWVVDTLQAVHDQPSIRRAAAMLHVHHSTLQERLAWLGGQLGYDPSAGRGRQRAGLSLLLWRVSKSDG